MKKVLVGLSGGVDSAVAAYLLKNEGYDVVAGFMINYLAPEGEYCPTKDDLEVAREVAEFLEIPFFVFDYREEYEKKVLDYMYEGYKKGITPNPDIMCNSEVKFKVFLEEALALGYDMIATGHYARINSDQQETTSPQPSPTVEGVEQTFSLSPVGEGVRGGGYHLKKGIDPTKDQSYFLAGLDQFQLSKALFPIGGMKKEDVRKLALEIGLPNAKRKDSQGICFVGKVDLTKFLEKKIKPKPGKILDTSGNILGEHKGVFYYTIGQRKGLDLGGQKEPVFIVKKNIQKNEIIVGTSKDLELYNDELFIREFHFLGKNDFEFPLKAKCKIRYRQEDQECEIFKTSPQPSPLEERGLENISGYIVKFKNKQRAIASGQICAVYLGDELIMSGVIE